MKTKSGVNLGISLPYSFPDARVDHADIRRFVRQAEALGFDDGWLTEGILNPNFVLEPVTYIAHLAALTEKMTQAQVSSAVVMAPWPCRSQ